MRTTAQRNSTGAAGTTGATRNTQQQVGWGREGEWGRTSQPERVRFLRRLRGRGRRREYRLHVWFSHGAVDWGFRLRLRRHRVACWWVSGG